VSEHELRCGLVALGDSLTRGSGQELLGVRMQSWALWLAEALSLPYTCLAGDGAHARDVVAAQLPRLRGSYDLGCVYIGVNDVRTPGFQPERLREELEQIVEGVRARARLLLLVSPPRALGVPPAPPWAIASAASATAELARAHGAMLVSADGLTGAELLQPDAVHLTARGQAMLALRACEQLRGAGLAADTAELQRALRPPSAGARARWLLGPHLVALLRDHRRRAVEAAARWRGRVQL